MQQLEQNEPEQNEEDNIPITEITKTEYIDFSKISEDSSITKLLVPKKLYSHYRLGTYGQFNWEVFHPPQA